MKTDKDLEKEQDRYLSTEQYMYRRIADLCLNYLRIDQMLGKSRDRTKNRMIARQLANIFESIRSFVKEEEKFPFYIRNPPLASWSIRDTKEPDLFVLAPRYAKDYILSVYREIRKQQSKKKREITAISDMFQGDKQ